ncbi:MAG TPA: hypothetical protein PLV55_06035 [Anaerohalosphaeraceae bacterium]|nr:hypothetical protein [Anaerohalosphaeraceae bacterium]
MNFRKMTHDDLLYLQNHSIRPIGFCTLCPEEIDFDYTLEHEGKVLGAGGFRLIASSTAWAWVQIAPEALENLVTVYRVIKEWMDIWAQTHKIHRIQAWVDVSHEEGKRMAEHLGFHKESKMTDFLGPKKGAWLYVKLYP